MQLPVFEQAYLLQSIGWAIANSFWQTGVLWLIYKGITTINKKLPALVKYYLSLVLLISSFSWFIFTIVKNYGLFTYHNLSPEIILNQEIIWGLKTVNNLLPFISVLYLVLLCSQVVLYIKNVSQNNFLQKNGLTKAPIDFRLFATHTAINLGINKKIQVWLSAHVDVPSVTGFIKPVILLPAAIVSQLSVQQIEAILLHELGHIKRNDYLVNLLQSILELILFFNPFALLLSKTIKIEREYCCDDWVINFQYDQHAYANALLILEEQRQIQPLSFVLAATNGKKNLLLRVKRLFNTPPQTTIRTSQKLQLTFFSVLLLLGILVLAPFFSNNPEIVESRLNNKGNKNEKINMVIPIQPTNENHSGVIINTPNIKPIAKVSTGKVKKITKKRAGNDPGGEYINAFINEELLNPALKETPIPSLVVDKEIANSTYIIKIEEQQSGKKETTTYYLELNNKDGNTDIKPLIIYDQLKGKGKGTATENLKDSIGTLKSPQLKKRITS